MCLVQVYLVPGGKGGREGMVPGARLFRRRNAREGEGTFAAADEGVCLVKVSEWCFVNIAKVTSISSL